MQAHPSSIYIPPGNVAHCMTPTTTTLVLCLAEGSGVLLRTLGVLGVLGVLRSLEILGDKSELLGLVGGVSPALVLFGLLAIPFFVVQAILDDTLND